MNIGNKLEKLQCTFPKLTEANQHYVLGLAEGLKRAQGGKLKTEPWHMEMKILQMEEKK